MNQAKFLKILTLLITLELFFSAKECNPLECNAKSLSKINLHCLRCSKEQKYRTLLAEIKDSPSGFKDYSESQNKLPLRNFMTMVDTSLYLNEDFIGGIYIIYTFYEDQLKSKLDLLENFELHSLDDLKSLISIVRDSQNNMDEDNFTRISKLINKIFESASVNSISMLIITESISFCFTRIEAFHAKDTFIYGIYLRLPQIVNLTEQGRGKFFVRMIQLKKNTGDHNFIDFNDFFHLELYDPGQNSHIFVNYKLMTYRYQDCNNKCMAFDLQEKKWTDDGIYSFKEGSTFFECSVVNNIRNKSINTNHLLSFGCQNNPKNLSHPPSDLLSGVIFYNFLIITFFLIIRKAYSTFAKKSYALVSIKN
jgi:hypothetical protein